MPGSSLIGQQYHGSLPLVLSLLLSALLAGFQRPAALALVGNEIVLSVAQETKTSIRSSRL